MIPAGVVLRNYTITPTRAPADVRDASQPAPIRRGPRGCSPIRRRVSGVAEGATRPARSAIDRTTIRAGALSPAPAALDHYGWR
jgi:hypothetical protein